MTKTDYIRMLRHRLPLADTIANTVELIRSTQGFYGKCPSHAGPTGSLHVDPAMGVYQCFACGRVGDIVTWTMDRDGLDESMAIEILGKRASLPSPPSQ